MDKRQEIIDSINNVQDDLLKDLASLVKIPSVRDLKSKKTNAPFGIQIRNAMDEFLIIAEKLGYQAYDVDGYAVYAQLGDSPDHLGILGHLDVVEAGDLSDWITPPFELTIKDDYMFGRGVNDDKGPLLGALYAGKIAYALTNQPKRSIRVIAGGAEETTWECVDYYFTKEEQPSVAFSPDGNFPVVNGEKGVYQVCLKFETPTTASLKSYPEINFVCEELKVDGEVFKGDVNLSRNPDRGKNAIDEYVNSGSVNHQNESWYRFIKDNLNNAFDGKKLGLNTEHVDMGELSVCMMSLKTDDKGYVLLSLDFRFPVSITKEEIENKLMHLAGKYGFTIEEIKYMKPLYVDADGGLVQSLLDAYEIVMDERPSPITKGGASYARSLENGVAFGATFDGEDTRPHMSNEQMRISSLKKAMEIYVHAIHKLIS